jgi:hypothetical protein
MLTPDPRLECAVHSFNFAELTVSDSSSAHARHPPRCTANSTSANFASAQPISFAFTAKEIRLSLSVGRICESYFQAKENGEHMD